MKLTTLALFLFLLVRIGLCQATNSDDSTYLPLPIKRAVSEKTNATHQETRQKSKTQSLVSDILNSNLAAALIGFASALFVFYLTEQSQHKKQADESREKYLVLLNSTRNELAFYVGKLTTLKEKLFSAISDVKDNKAGIILPSFSLYPAFLEQAKIEINALFRNASLVKEVGHCHFELCHVLERLNWLKSQQFIEMVNASQHHKAAIINLSSIQSLVESTISAFQQTASKLDAEIQAVSN